MKVHLKKQDHTPYLWCGQRYVPANRVKQRFSTAVTCKLCRANYLRSRQGWMK